MSATEELQRLLDERGVEHVDLLDKTMYKPSENATCTATRRLGDTLEVSVRIYGATPEQAVEATLGHKRDERLAARMTDVMMRVECVLGVDHGGAEVLSAEVAPLLSEALEIIDTAAATRRGECAFEWSLADNGWADHTCSECGFVENTDVHVKLGWSYCPNCGAKVVGQ